MGQPCTAFSLTSPRRRHYRRRRSTRQDSQRSHVSGLKCKQRYARLATRGRSKVLSQASEAISASTSPRKRNWSQPIARLHIVRPGRCPACFALFRHSTHDYGPAVWSVRTGRLLHAQWHGTGERLEPGDPAEVRNDRSHASRRSARPPPAKNDRNCEARPARTGCRARTSSSQ
jgi:hypothetical protein